MEVEAITPFAKMKLEGPAWSNFIGAIKSAESRETYASKLIFMEKWRQERAP